MDSTHWDARYAASPLVWSAGPNATVVELTAELPPGRALDLGAGEGRNSLWLAEHGWDVTAVDFSAVGTQRTRDLATERLGAAASRVTAITEDLVAWAPPVRAFDLVLVIYLHLVEADRAVVLRWAADAVAPGGRLIVLGHDRANLEDGVGGPQDPQVLFTPDEVVGDLSESGLHVVRAATIRRPVTTDEGPRDALDCLVVAICPPEPLP